MSSFRSRSKPRALADWQAYVDALSAQRLRGEALAVGSVRSMSALAEEGLDAGRVSEIQRVFGRRLVASGLDLPVGGDCVIDHARLLASGPAPPLDLGAGPAWGKRPPAARYVGMEQTAQPTPIRGRPRDFLVRVYAHESVPAAGAPPGREHWRAAGYALRRGLVELADEGGPLGPRERDGTRPVRLTLLGRARLGVSAPRTAGAWHPFLVLRAATSQFIAGEVALWFDRASGLYVTSTDAGPEPWPDCALAIARLCTEQGVPCEAVLEDVFGCGLLLLRGFRVTPPSGGES